MRILIVSNMYPNKKYPSYGIFVKKFCDELEKNNISYEKSVMYKTNNAFFKIINYIIFYGKTFLKAILKKYDIVYIHYASHSSLPILIASKLKKMKIYINIHGSDAAPENKMQEKFQKNTIKILKISEKVIVPSEYFKEYVAAKYKINKNIIYIYPSGGVDTKIFRQLTQEERKSIKEKYNLSSKVTFCFAGRLTKQKGCDIYIKAIDIIEKKGYSANYILVGSGKEEYNLNKLIESLNLKNKIKKLPLLSQEELVKIYNISDAFIFPTKGESLGLVAIESMACGTPVIASDFSAPKYYIEDNINGLKFELGNYNQLADIMIEFIEGKRKKEDFKVGVQNTVEKYEKNSITDKFSEIFAENR